MTVAKRDLRKFFPRALLLSAPLVTTLAMYAAWDPFRVLLPHDFGDYYDEAAPVELNRDYVSLEMFLRNDPREHYDSFILGSSRSFPLHCDTWQKYVPGIKPFHYPAASENLQGLLLKLKYLSDNGHPLKHVIVETAPVSLRDLSARIDTTHRLPYRLSGESWLDFQGAYLSWYFKDLFFLEFAHYKLLGHVRPSARRMLGIRHRQVRIDPLTNDYYWAELERELAADEGAFYARFAQRYPRTEGDPPPCEPPSIGDAQRKYLESIREIFAKHATKYRILIPPVYDRVCTDPRDVAILGEIFGSDNVFVFTGDNEITRDKRNFYDINHVRPFVADKLVATMYGAATVASKGPQP
jgi:hypothetical protein